ncbi:MAG: N-(5'-phosphoribosyl)anthranilate isomerase [Coxiella sp. (in: Bacteria)]|nr:MAG: N-(5'-phosphoribosyl)anthranilate isomerase [Coxiella sp. (in: g-proteobacteria)]
MTTQLKICGLTDPIMAAEAIVQGVTYIGLIFHPASKRHVTLDKAIAIAAAVHDAGGLIVPVFVDQQADEILDIATAVHADFVQLHGPTAAAAYSMLTAQYPCIVAQQFSQILKLDPQRDYLLYDYEEPGSGQPFDWQQVTLDPHYRAFIAGGITAETIPDAIAHFYPFALDISSGAESVLGVKDLDKIKACYDAVERSNNE